MSTNTSLLKVLSLTARERRIVKGNDTETNLTAKLGRAPTFEELTSAMQAELDSMFGKKDGDQ